MSYLRNYRGVARLHDYEPEYGTCQGYELITFRTQFGSKVMKITDTNGKVILDTDMSNAIKWDEFVELCDIYVER